jgi:tRNA dimethylallyltransferase
MGMNEPARVVALLGPTAVGKTSCSLSLARQFPFEIVSADSRLFYRGMDIGTAKPAQEELQQVPHHLIDVSEPDEPWSLDRYLVAAGQVIDAIAGRGRMALLAGGTGQYLTALLEGWQPPPRPDDDSIRIELESFVHTHGADALYRKLQDVDPVRAAELDPRNVRRVIRALEIYRVTGQPPSSFQRKSPPDYIVLRIGLTLPRSELFDRIDARIDQMLADGWVVEVQALLDQGPPEGSIFSAIGYSELAAYLQGRISLDEAVVQIKRVTRTFVRRQANWFKLDDPSIHWFRADQEPAEKAAELIERWLSGG